MSVDLNISIKELNTIFKDKFGIKLTFNTTIESQNQGKSVIVVDVDDEMLMLLVSVYWSNLIVCWL